MDLRQRINEMEYRELKGESAVEAAYSSIFRRYDKPKNEADLMMTLFNPQGFRDLFDMYFFLHPENAKQIVNDHSERYSGRMKLLEPFAYFGNQLRAARYHSAKQSLESELQNTMDSTPPNE